MKNLLFSKNFFYLLLIPLVLLSYSSEAQEPKKMGRFWEYIYGENTPQKTQVIQ